MINQIGIDIIDLERIKLNLTFLNHVLSPVEQTDLATINDDSRKKSYVAGRWAAKEAITKVLKTPISWPKISIISNRDGALTVDGCNLPCNHHIKISISHEKKYAIAVAIYEIL